MLQDHGTVDERDIRAESDHATYYVEFWTGDAWVDVHKVVSDSALELVDWARSQAVARASTHLKVNFVAAHGDEAALHSYLCHDERWQPAGDGLIDVAATPLTPTELA